MDFEDDVVEEANTTAKTVDNHCPFGCVSENLDELGYCRHLVGFTNFVKGGSPKTKFYEEIEEIILRDGTPSGMKRTNGRKRREILTNDVLVNPEIDQLDKGIWHKAKKWVSSRVYRKNPSKAEPLTKASA